MDGRRTKRSGMPSDEKGSPGAGMSVKAVSCGIILIFMVCSMQFVLLSRHTDAAHSAEVVGSNLLKEHEANLRVLMMQQRDLLRVTGELGKSLQSQRQEIKEVETQLVALKQNQRQLASRQHMRGSTAADSAAAARAADEEPAKLEHAAEKPDEEILKLQQLEKNVKQLEAQTDEAVRHAAAAGEAAAAGSPAFQNLESKLSELETEFPAEWLQRFSLEELQKSAAQAAKWRTGTRAAFQHAWKGYKSRAWGADEMKPQTGERARTWANCGLQIIDALSTLWVMDLKEEFQESARWIEANVHWDFAGQVSFFEMTIRALGGLVSAHSLSGMDVFLEKAKALADRMLPAFQGESGFPTTQVNLKNGHGSPGWYKGTVLAEAGTVQLEFRYISQLTGDQRYAQKADKSMRSIIAASKGRGLVPWGLSSPGSPPHATNSHITFGAMGDSYYEYLLKMWVQTDKSESEWKEQWKEAMNEMHERLILKTDGGLTYVAEENGGSISHKMDHLACFVGGMLIYGARTLPKKEVDGQWEATAEGITETCYQMYHRQPSHLAPECVTLHPHSAHGRDMDVWNNAGHYLLRPEAAEAIFYMFYYTGDPKYRRMAGEIFEAIEQNTKTTYGYSAVADVRQPRPRLRNEMETFFLAETLKYLYLTFLPNPRKVLSLDEFVFNTEAHPIRIFRNANGGGR
eukprot:TRINITY_DN27839_c0_g1_i1.p1 TRINITY_DN27839_c0_g1~~TRINITY_DN27839_c0_g1_i1.p1  ORF type:complete len:687 (+),score=184.46 TRINITY_DN27839_c0_g1_i1:151-2211(+)